MKMKAEAGGRGGERTGRGVGAGGIFFGARPSRAGGADDGPGEHSADPSTSLVPPTGTRSTSTPGAGARGGRAGRARARFATHQGSGVRVLGGVAEGRPRVAAPVLRAVEDLPMPSGELLPQPPARLGVVRRERADDGHRISGASSSG